MANKYVIWDEKLVWIAWGESVIEYKIIKSLSPKENGKVNILLPPPLTKTRGTNWQNKLLYPW